MESKKAKLIETQSRIEVTRYCGVGKTGDVGQRVQTSSYKMNKSGDLMYNMVTIVNNTALYS